MKTLPIDKVNQLLGHNSHRTDDLIRPLIVETTYARYIQFIHRVRWWIGDDTSNTNSDAYEMYVRSKCIKHKSQVKYVSQAKPLDKLCYRFNRHPSEQI